MPPEVDHLERGPALSKVLVKGGTVTVNYDEAAKKQVVVEKRRPGITYDFGFRARLVSPLSPRLSKTNPSAIEAINLLLGTYQLLCAKFNTHSVGWRL